MGIMERISIHIDGGNFYHPAIDWIRHRGKRIEYIGFSIPDEKDSRHATTPLLSLIKKTDVQRILVKSDLEAFIKNDLFSPKVDS